MALDLILSAKPGNADTLVVATDGKGKLPAPAADLLSLYGSLTTGSFTAKWGQTLTVPLAKGAAFERVLVIGLKREAKASPADYFTLGGKIAGGLKAAGARKAFMPGHGTALPAEGVAGIVEGVLFFTYRFDKYKTPKKDDDKSKLASFTVEPVGGAKGKSAIEDKIKLVEATAFARDLVNEPPNQLYPESYADRIVKTLKPLGVSVEVFDEKDLTKMKAGGILCVAQGSDRPARMVIMRWNGTGKKGGKPTALVGKGVTFDTGGISIKPANGMEEMKYDMGGSAAVVGTMYALAKTKAKVDVVGAVGLVENMPSGTATRPSDIVVSHAGKTVEVLNTDAEGRLVLMDVLSYVQKTHKPGTIIDLATLTGAIVIALGGTFAGAFANNDKLWAKLHAAGEATGERLWRMPLDEAYRKAMEGSVSDLQNLSNWDRGGGSCTAAGFLEHFIEGGVHWAHLDIAGTAWGGKGNPMPKGGTGYGVRLLFDYLHRA